MNPVDVAESFGGLTQGLRTVVMRRDASNALAPRNESVPAERPSAGRCSPRDVVLSDASTNALAPRAAFASAAGDFDYGFFDDAVTSAGVLAGRVTQCTATQRT